MVGVRGCELFARGIPVSLPQFVKGLGICKLGIGENGVQSR